MQKNDSRFHAASSFALRVARRARLAHPTMGLQGKRWPKWKPRRDNSSQDLTDENRKKKLHHGVKCIRKVCWFSSPSRISSRAPLGAWRRVARTPALIANEFARSPHALPLAATRAQALKKARTFEAQKIKRRVAQAAAAAAAKALAEKGKTKKAAKLAPPPSAVVDPEKLERQLKAVDALDLEALGELMGNATFDAVLASRDAPSADAALPVVGDAGANQAAAEKAEKAVGAKAIEAAGDLRPALVVARRVLGAACVREEVNALQEKLVLVGDRQQWALGRIAREEARRAAKEAANEKKEEEREEKRAEKEQAVARTKSRGPGDVDAQGYDDEDGEKDEEKDEDDGSTRNSDSDSDDGASASDSATGEDDWSSGGEDDPRRMESGESDSDSEDVVIRDDGGDELRKFLAEENGEDVSDEDEDDGAFARESDSDVDPDEELPPELAKILGVQQKGTDATRASGKGGKRNTEQPKTKQEPAKKQKKPKKRMGQRARRALAEQMFGDNANHVKMEREERERQRKQQADQEANMHPAWAAKRAAAAALAAAPKGRKVAFGEDGAVAGDLGHAGPRREVPPPPSGVRGGRGGRGGGRDGGRGGGRGGVDRSTKKKMSPPAVAKKPKEKAPRAPKVYIGEIKGGTGEVVGKVTKPMGPSGEKPKDAKDSKGKSGGGMQYDADAAAAAHPAWAAKRKAANEAWGSVKPEGKKIKFT